MGRETNVEPVVEIAEGTAFEVLVGAAAVADEDWRQVFAIGPAVYADALSRCGPRFVERVGAFGRYGWLNLAGLLVRSPPPWDLDALLGAVRRSPAEDVHLVCVGGARPQLLTLVDEPVIRGALRGDAASRRRVLAAFDSDQIVLEGSPWLLSASSTDVSDAVGDILATWSERLLPPAAEVIAATAGAHQASAARTVLAETSGRRYLTDVIGGLSYDPPGLGRVLAVPSAGVAPVVVVVDGREQTVILHPPVRRPAAGPDDRLVELGRAVGDRTRIRLLTVLRDGETTAVDLAAALSAPRTTLLHHLAILRAAGLIEVTVTPGGATVYRLRPEGLRELAAHAAGFVSTG